MYMEVIIFSMIFATLFTTKNINFTILISNIVDQYSPIRQHRMSSLSQWGSNTAKCPSNMHCVPYALTGLWYSFFGLWSSRADPKTLPYLKFKTQVLSSGLILIYCQVPTSWSRQPWRKRCAWKWIQWRHKRARLEGQADY
jgi:hypothetical protein